MTLIHCRSSPLCIRLRRCRFLPYMALIPLFQISLTFESFDLEVIVTAMLMLLSNAVILVLYCDLLCFHLRSLFIIKSYTILVNLRSEETACFDKRKSIVIEEPVKHCELRRKPVQGTRTGHIH